jgi:CRISPR type IV-associated protein Csf2
MHPMLRDQVIPEESLRAHNYETDTYFDVPLTTKLILTGKDDLLAGKGQDRVEDYQKSLDDWLAQVVGGRAAKADTKALKAAAKKAGTKVDPETPEGKSVDLAAFNTLEAMLPGTRLQFWLRFKEKATPAQIGLGLMAVQDWANANVIGGASARGFGRFEARLALVDGDAMIAPTIFNPNDHATAYTLSEDVAVYTSAAAKALKKITLADLHTVYPVKGATAVAEEA